MSPGFFGGHQNLEIHVQLLLRWLKVQSIVPLLWGGKASPFLKPKREARKSPKKGTEPGPRLFAFRLGPWLWGPTMGLGWAPLWSVRKNGRNMPRSNSVFLFSNTTRRKCFESRGDPHAPWFCFWHTWLPSNPSAKEFPPKRTAPFWSGQKAG